MATKHTVRILEKEERRTDVRRSVALTHRNDTVKQSEGGGGGFDITLGGREVCGYANYGTLTINYTMILDSRLLETNTAPR